MFLDVVAKVPKGLGRVYLAVIDPPFASRGRWSTQVEEEEEEDWKDTQGESQAIGRPHGRLCHHISKLFWRCRLQENEEGINYTQPTMRS